MQNQISRTITIPTKTLSELLDEADKLFEYKNKSPKLSCYAFTLARFPYGWVFNVVNSWHKWSSAGLDYQFGAWEKPEYAIQDFLEYVKTNNINVKELMEKETQES